MDDRPPVATEPNFDRDIRNQNRMRSRIRCMIRDELIFHGIRPDNIEAYVNDTALRNDVIRAAYDRERAKGVKAERLIVILKEAFGLSYAAIYRIVHDRKESKR